MQEEITYMLAIVAVGFAVNFGLRAIPFLLFAGKGRELPKCVERFGDLISPVIIACLVVYSCSGLAWKTPWPYLAGLLTVGIQLWRRNPLASIIAGTVLYMVLVGCTGCTTVSAETFKQDRFNPLISVSSAGIRFQGRPVVPAEVPERLEDLGVPKTDTVYILVEDGYDGTPTGRRALWVFQHNYLNRAGYSKTMMIHPLISESGSAEEVETKLGSGSVPFREAGPMRPTGGAR